MSEPERQPSDVPPDPSGIEEPHDVLAAEEFGIGTRNERVPADPRGIREPHDVLAADEFPMPTGSEQPADADGLGADAAGGPDPRVLVPLVLLVATLALIVLRRRR